MQEVNIYANVPYRDKRYMDKQINKNTIKFHTALTEDLLPKMEKMTVEEDVMHEDGTVERLKPRQATMQEKNKLLFAMANRQAKLQSQIEWLRSEQERHRGEDDV